MGFLDISKLSFEYFRRDSAGNLSEMVEALKDVDITVNEGEFIAIVGANGSGKSTLARHINALLLPGSGEVIVDGMNTSDAGLTFDIRKTVGMVFQNPDNQIVGSVVSEDVAFGPENLAVPSKDIKERVKKGLSKVGMSKHFDSSVNALSGGEKQRVAIAGILAMENKCIIFDEATAMLNPASRKEVAEIARKLSVEKHKTVIYITHHLDEIRHADRVFVLRQGKIALSGTPFEVFSKGDALRECGLLLPDFEFYKGKLYEKGVIDSHISKKIENISELAKVIEYGYDAKIKPKEPLDYAKAGMAPGKGILFNNVSFSYEGSDENALKNINLHFDRGEFVAVVGRNGAGKSTLQQLCNGLLKPSDGQVYFDGIDISEKDYPLSVLRQKVGVLFQYPEYQLFGETVEKDVLFGPSNMGISDVEAMKRTYEAIEKVGLPDTIYDASPLSLSGGQKRRVALAGVLAMKPDILILDEPTAGIDPVSAREILMILKKYQMELGMGIVIISHNMEEIAEFADRMVVLEKGEIRCDEPVWKAFCREEMLKGCGLELPDGVKLLHIMREDGLVVDTTRCKREDIWSEILRLDNITM